MIETFPENTVLDSTYTTFTQGVLPTTSIRVKIDHKPIEYAFYDVLDCNQQLLTYTSESISQLYILQESKELSKVLENIPDLPSQEIDLTEFKHYVLIIKDQRFDVFAAEHTKENGFLEIYREQTLVKKITT